MLADIHGNLPALEAVIADMAGRSIDAVVDLGDCVSGPLWPEETLRLLRAKDWMTVRGNHDRWVACGDPSTLSRLDGFAAAAVGEDGRAWLGALPARLAPMPGIAAFHARPDDDNAYLLEDIVAGRLQGAPAASVEARLGTVRDPLILTAHSHLPGLLRLADGRTVLNPGSVGCPAYADQDPPAHVSETGSPFARYAVLTFEAGDTPQHVVADHIALPYDHAAAARRAEAAGYPGWSHALAQGRMPDPPSRR